ncbi:MAG: response regulator transcription factor [Bdellovibrionota bacterium]
MLFDIKLIWILEDDPSAIFVYEEILQVRYQIKTFRTLQEFSHALSSSDKLPDLLIADLKLSDDHFLRFLSQDPGKVKLRTIPFIVVSSSEDLDLVRDCFRHGASDYLTKPFSKVELIAKVENLLKERHCPQKNEPTGFDEYLKLDPIHLKAETEKFGCIQLTTKEMQIINLLQKAKGSPVVRSIIFKEVWDDISVGSKTLDVHISNLRRKLLNLSFDIAYVAPDSFQLKRSDESSSHQGMTDSICQISTE